VVSIHRPHTLIELAMAPSAAQFAEELLRAYLPEVEDHLQPRAERSPWHILRMVPEAMACAWFVRRIGSVQES
jgi:hypothetical protein